MAAQRPRLQFVMIAIASDQPDEGADDVAGPWNYRIELPTKLLTSKVVLASRPHAGGVLSARLGVTMIRGDYRETVYSANVTARAVIAKRPLRLLHTGSTGSGLGATWRVPSWAHNQTLHGSVTISFNGTHATRTFSATVK